LKKYLKSYPLEDKILDIFSNKELGCRKKRIIGKIKIIKKHSLKWDNK